MNQGKSNRITLMARSTVNRGDEMTMERRITVVIERDEEGFLIASVPALPGCHTQARSLDQLMERIKEAIELYLDVESSSIEPTALDFVGIQQVIVDR